MESKRLLCSLCNVDMPVDFVDIFQDFEDSIIAAILTQHFGLRIDGSSDCLCQVCWTKTKNFHIFYKKMETLQKNRLKSQHTFDTHENQKTNNSSNNVIKVERSLSPMDTVGTNEYIVETDEMKTAIDFDPQIKREGSFDASYDPSEFADNKSKNSENEKKSSKVKRKPQNKDVSKSDNGKLDDTDEPSHQRSNKGKTNRRKNCQTNTSKRDFATEDAQIRDFFEMKCEICSDQFETIVDAKNHYATIHNTAGYLICCRRKFAHRYRALEHIRSHLNPQRFECYKCGKHCVNKNSLKHHIGNHDPRASKCDMCSSSFTNSWKLAIHKRRYHCSEEDKKFHCNQCDKKFVIKSMLTYHIRGTHEGAHTKVCEICAKVCKNETTFRSHMEGHSTALQPKIQCKVCDLWLKNEDSLRKHMDQHQGTAKTVNCSICSNVLKSDKALKNHIRIVHGDRKHRCTLCDKAFTRERVLKEHMILHTGGFMYICRYCKQQFKTDNNMRYHQKKVHLEEVKRDRSKNFKKQ